RTAIRAPSRHVAAIRAIPRTCASASSLWAANSVEQRPALISAPVGRCSKPNTPDELLGETVLASWYRNGIVSNNTARPSVALPSGALTARTTSAQRAIQRRNPSGRGSQLVLAESAANEIGRASCRERV